MVRPQFHGMWTGAHDTTVVWVSEWVGEWVVESKWVSWWVSCYRNTVTPSAVLRAVSAHRAETSLQLTATDWAHLAWLLASQRATGMFCDRPNRAEFSWFSSCLRASAERFPFQLHGSHTALPICTSVNINPIALRSTKLLNLKMAQNAAPPQQYDGT